MDDFSLVAQLRAYVADRLANGRSKTDGTRCLDARAASPTAGRVLAALAEGERRCRTAQDLSVALADVCVGHISRILRHLARRGEIVRLPPDKRGRSYRYTIERGNDHGN